LKYGVDFLLCKLSIHGFSKAYEVIGRPKRPAQNRRNSDGELTKNRRWSLVQWQHLGGGAQADITSHLNQAADQVRRAAAAGCAGEPGKS
jgi:hypothetical protein